MFFLIAVIHHQFIRERLDGLLMTENE